MAALTDWLQSPELQRMGDRRAGVASDAVGGAVPALVIEPTTGGEMAAALAWASREKLPTVVRGRGTKMGWGRQPSAVDVVLSTARLNGGLVHRHGDLTATVQAGMTLADFNRQLGVQRQWLPIDTPFQPATIGGLIATNDAGPLRHRYGTPRDQLIGMTLALTDGTLVKSGGHVVKNVAGYDLAKLISGSFGTLAVIVDATFKLMPLTVNSETVLVDYGSDVAAAGRDVAAIASSQLEPTAFDVRFHAGPGRSAVRCEVAIKFASSPEATRAQAEAVRGLIAGQPQTLSGDAEAAYWSEQVRRPWGRGGAIARFGWLPARLTDLLMFLRDAAERAPAASAGELELTARAALGAGVLRVDDVMAADVVHQLRTRADLVSNVVVIRQSTAAPLDPWGPPPPTAALLASLKRTFDPAGILNAGRGPI